MIHRLLPVLLFAVIVGTWYGVSSAVYAYVVAPPSEAETSHSLVEETPPREVQLVVVGQEEDPSPTVKEDDFHSVDEELKTEDSLSPQEVEILLDELMGEVGPAPVTTEVVGETEVQPAPARPATTGSVFTVPFYSQFADISSASWQKVGCGIASLAMLIDFYSDDRISVDGLLQKGIAAGAYLDNAGWIHSGLIGLSRAYGLDGESRSLAGLSMSEAFASLEKAVSEGPVMVSVHYTFEPTNPIPHLVVINGVRDGKVFYNDPAEGNGGNALSIEKFQRAWKKRYIEIRPV